MAHRQYELIYVLTPDIGEQDVTDLHGQVEAIAARFGGRLDKTENWGRRRLAYEIGHHKEGLYVLELLTGPGEMIKELDRRLRVMDAVIRHLIVRVDEALRVAERDTSRRKAEVARRRLARGLPAEVAQGEGPERRGEGEERAEGRREEAEA
jgi:small subunit ribosomal protein S6